MHRNFQGLGPTHVILSALLQCMVPCTQLLLSSRTAKSASNNVSFLKTIHQGLEIISMKSLQRVACNQDIEKKAGWGLSKFAKHLKWQESLAEISEILPFHLHGSMSIFLSRMWTLPGEKPWFLSSFISNNEHSVWLALSECLVDNLPPKQYLSTCILWR